MKFAAYLGAVLVLIGLSSLYLGFKINNFNTYFLIGGGVMAGIGFFLLKFLSRKDKDDSFAKFDDWRKRLKAAGTEIMVPFDQCELKSNNYREEVDQDDSPTSQYMALDTLIGRDNTEYKNIDQSVIVFKTEFNGEQVIFYSPLINKEKTTLEFLLANKESTKIYVDRFNKNNYYFDLEFIWAIPN